MIIKINDKIPFSLSLIKASAFYVLLNDIQFGKRVIYKDISYYYYLRFEWLFWEFYISIHKK